MVDADDGSATPLFDTGPAAAAFSPDGSRLAVVLTPDSPKPPDLLSGTFVFDRDGQELWRSPVTGFAPNPRWSPDGTRLAVDADTLPDVRALQLHVFDGATGEEQYRIEGALACQDPVWTADGSKLIVGSYTRQGAVVADPATQTFEQLSVYAVPSPFDASLGVSFDGFDFSTVDLDTGEATFLTHTTVGPGWDFLHEPLFAGGRIVFAAPHGGHGGCLEGGAPDPLPELAWRFPPFA
jgi:dipeptidyl aminopeptidase/acylaminoacyl peptidase